MLWCVQTEIVRGKSADLIAPEDPVTVAEALTMLKRAAELPDVSGIHADLHALTAVHRPVGSKGENGAVQYLKKRFTEMGYEVTLQSYEDGQGRKGTNVVAVKAAPLPDADILVLSAHHDSVPTAYGANDNASGVAALLYVAELLQDIPTDTEVRFISFTDEENGKCGSRFYTGRSRNGGRAGVHNGWRGQLGQRLAAAAGFCAAPRGGNSQRPRFFAVGRRALGAADAKWPGIPLSLCRRYGGTAQSLCHCQNGRARGGCGKGNPFCRYAVLPGTGAGTGTGTELYLSSDTAKCDLLWKFPLRY